MYTLIFPGQGSQSVGMGHEVYQAFPEAREVFQEVDEALKQNLSQLIFNGPEEELTLTANAQPALMAVSMAILRVLESSGSFNIAASVGCVAGHSLGEYSALTAAQVLTLDDTALLLRTRGQAMQNAVPVGEGAMAAILGLDYDAVTGLAERAAESDICAVANDNAPGQIVVSGHKQAVERAMALAKDAGARKSVLLPVSAPFHSSLMEPAAMVMKSALDQVNFSPPLVPVVANFTAQFEMDPSMLKDLLVQQITGQVRWRESMSVISGQGLGNLIEVGAGKVLTGLAKRINPDLKARAISTPQDIEDFLQEVS